MVSTRISWFHSTSFKHKRSQSVGIVFAYPFCVSVKTFKQTRRRKQNFGRHVFLSNLKHAPSRELPLTARKTVFSHLNSNWDLWRKLRDGNNLKIFVLGKKIGWQKKPEKLGKKVLWNWGRKHIIITTGSTTYSLTHCQIHFIGNF